MNRKIPSKNEVIRRFEMTMYCVVTILLLFIIFYHYYALIENVIKHHNISNLTDSESEIAVKAVTALVIELISTIGMVSFFFI
jgi:ABC-type xylose transport system permease subunit